MQTIITEGHEGSAVPAADGTAARRYFGKYAATVTNNAPTAQGIQPGTIEVQIPGLLEEGPPPPADPAASVPGGPPSPPPPNQALTVLALPCFLPGFFFIPQNQAPVWVEFVAGDINYPIWTGVWYPSNSTSFKAPLDSDDSAPDQDQKVIRTGPPAGAGQAPSGQVIHLSDKSGSEKTVIKDEKNGNKITLDSSGVTIECLIDANGDATNTDTLATRGITVESHPQPSSVTTSITLYSSGVSVTFGSISLTVLPGTIQVTAGQGPTAPSITVDQSNGVTISAGPTSQVALSSSQGVQVTSAAGALSPVLVMPSTLLNWLLGHQHIGNMGAPTPLFPADIATMSAFLALNTLASSAG